MGRARALILCLAYIIGLLVASWQQWAIAVTSLILFTLLAAIFLPRLWSRSPRGKFWLGVGLVAIFAVVYWQIRFPRPSSHDISKILFNSSSRLVVVSGKALTEASLTSNQQRYRFWLQADKVEMSKEKMQSVSGKLYITVPKSPKVAIYPDQSITVKGVLYRPRTPTNPGTFDFKAYLAKEGAFAGLKGSEIISQGKEPSFGWWKLRQRIVTALTAKMGKTEGAVVGSMVLGKYGVDLPPNIQDLFTKTGLVHVFAVSGFQVSLLLGSILYLTRSLLPLPRFAISSAGLGLYISLTGMQPSIGRAGIMGMGGLVGLLLERKVRPLGSLLFAATLLLLCNPLWIENLGFQLSFLATWGLIVTLPALMEGLDWLPNVIATIIALPLAATIWVLPLLLHNFSILATYSIFANIVTAPLVTVISLGGMVCAAIALIIPTLGSLLAIILVYPTQLLIRILQFFVNLPGSSYAVGKLSLGLMLVIYFLLGAVCFHPWWQRRWKLAGGIILALIVIPFTWTRLTLTQVTVLAAKPDPIVVIQDQGKVTLINSGNSDTIKYSLIPFLAQQGINRIDSTIAFNSSDIKTWSSVNPYINISQFYYLTGTPRLQPNTQKLEVGQTLSLGETKVQLLATKPPILSWQVQNSTWLWITDNTLLQGLSNQTPQVLLWSGKGFSQNLSVYPKVVIINTSFISKKIRQGLQYQGVKLYLTGKDGAIQWTPKQGFEATLSVPETTNSLGD